MKYIIQHANADHKIQHAETERRIFFRNILTTLAIKFPFVELYHVLKLEKRKKEE